jgi:colicin import membrane protein
MERERDKRERREAARVTDAEEEKARAEAFQKTHEERDAKRQAKAGNDAADLARRQAQAKGNTDVKREREYAERAAKVAERKKNYAEKLEREVAEKARKQAAQDAATKADQERGAFWSPRRWIKD